MWKREDLIGIVSSIPEDLLGAYSLSIDSSHSTLQMEFNSEIVKKYLPSGIVIDANGFVTFNIVSGGFNFKVILT